MTPVSRDGVFVRDYVLSNGLVLSGDPRTPIAALVREIFQDEIYAPAFHDTNRPVVLDVGANAGVFAVWASLPPRRAVVHAVEPVPSSFSLLRRNVARVGSASRTRFLQAAVADRSGMATLFLDRSASCDTLIPPASQDWEERTVSTITVPTLTLLEIYDSFSLSSCDVLKLDIEGGECQVLDAASDDVLRRADRIVVETHDYLVPHGSGAVRQRLVSAGFQVREAREALLFARRG